MPALKPVKKVPVAREVMRPTAPNFETLANNMTLKLYRRIAVSFVVVVAVVLFIVVYVSTNQATIHITPVTETVKTDFIVDVVPTPTTDSEVRGKVVAGTMGQTKSFTPSGAGKVETEGTARGEVTIYNTTESAQTLVKTTRLLTADGVLFRISNTVSVPAKGNVKVEAYADKPGKTGDIVAGKFTIPGLPASLQKVIYAESAAPMTGGLSSKAVVSDQDIVRAGGELKTVLETSAQDLLRKEAGEAFDGETFMTTIVEQKNSVAAGSEAANFEITMTIRVTGVFYQKQDVQTLAGRKLFDSLPAGKTFAQVNTQAIQTTVEKADLEGKTANLRVYLDGVAVPSVTGTALDAGRFVGKSAEETRKMLIEDGLAKDVKIDFFPFWVSHIPRLRDHVFIEIE